MLILRILTRGVGLPLTTNPLVELKFDEFKYILVSLLVARCSKDIEKGGDIYIMMQCLSVCNEKSSLS